MKRVRIHGLLCYQFSQLQNDSALNHFVFTRLNGVSPIPYNSLNVGQKVGDNNHNVRENHKRIRTALGGMAIATIEQSHSDEIVIFRDKLSKKQLNEARQKKADAMISNIAGLALLIQVADCQGIILYNDKKKVIANIHAGWRGSVKNIVSKTVQAMEKAFTCNPEDTIAGISPSLGPCCGEFIHYQDEIPSKYWSFQTTENYFDFWAITRHQLLESGLKDKNIYISEICTKCHTTDFFSYRGEGKTGRFAVVVGLN